MKARQKDHFKGPFKRLFDHKKYQSLSGCCRNMETESSEEAELDPVVHDKEGFCLFCRLSATVVGQSYPSVASPRTPCSPQPFLRFARGI